MAEKSDVNGKPSELVSQSSESTSEGSSKSSESSPETQRLTNGADKSSGEVNGDVSNVLHDKAEVKPDADTKSSEVEPRPYVNLTVIQDPNSIQPSEADVNPRPYVNLAVRERSDTPSSPKQTPAVSNKTAPFTTQISEPVLHSHSESGVRSKQALGESKLKLLSSDGESACKKCKELEGVVALWELGVSGLTRNYSKILSRLNKAREAARWLEGHELGQEEQPAGDAVVMRNASVSSRKAVTVRQSMYETSAGPLSPVRITDHMYPRDDSSAKLTVGQLKHFKELSSHLAEAIDLCQQLAAANFKSNQRSISKRRLQRQPTLPSKLSEDSSGSGYRPALQSIAEASTSGSFKKRTLERTPSVPDSVLRGQDQEGEDVATMATLPEQDRLESVEKVSSNTETSQSVGGEHTQDKAPAVSNSVHQPATDSATNQKQYISHMMKLSSEDELESEHSVELSGESEGENRVSVLSTASTFSDSDVKQIMSKIADLEEDRLKLLTTIDDLQTDNNKVRLSLGEILGDLQSKDLQLMLALQDLSLATGEIKKAAEMRRKLQEMETERDALYERLSNLEDESAAVKVSLIQLLQEKSATNKTLALENWRLSQRMKSTATGSGQKNGDGDNVSVISGFSSLNDDATLQEAYIGAEDVASFVHKQGFLVKQGGRRKNWKRRLFVLSPNGLSYYKTEQPLQNIPISSVGKVQISRRRSPYPHMFEVHTPGRVFLLSAPSEDEMQSWVGMLQTIKQYDKGTTLNKEALLRRQEVAGAEDGASPLSPVRHTSGELDSPDTSPDFRGVGPQHEAGLEEGGLVSPKRGAGPELSSDDDEFLIVRNNHFGSDDDAVELGATPMSVPTSIPLDEFGGVSLPSVKRLRSDST